MDRIKKLCLQAFLYFLIVTNAKALKCLNCVEVSRIPGCKGYEEYERMGVDMNKYGSFTKFLDKEHPLVCLTYTMNFLMGGTRSIVTLRGGMKEANLDAFAEVFSMFGKGVKTEWNRAGGMNCTFASDVDFQTILYLAGQTGVNSTQTGVNVNPGMTDFRLDSTEACECSVDNCNSGNFTQSVPKTSKKDEGTTAKPRTAGSDRRVQFCPANFVTTMVSIVIMNYWFSLQLIAAARSNS